MESTPNNSMSNNNNNNSDDNTQLVNNYVFSREFPNDILIEIFSHLYPKDIVRLGQVSRLFYKLSHAEILWQKFIKNKFGVNLKDEALKKAMRLFFFYAEKFENILNIEEKGWDEFFGVFDTLDIVIDQVKRFKEIVRRDIEDELEALITRLDRDQRKQAAIKIHNRFVLLKNSIEKVDIFRDYVVKFHIRDVLLRAYEAAEKEVSFGNFSKGYQNLVIKRLNSIGIKDKGYIESILAKEEYYQALSKLISDDAIDPDGLFEAKLKLLHERFNFKYLDQEILKYRSILNFKINPGHICSMQLLEVCVSLNLSRKIKKITLDLTDSIVDVPDLPGVPEYDNVVALLENIRAKVIILNANQLYKIPGNFFKVSNLTRLFLSENNIRVFPPEIGLAKNLLELRAGNNQLMQLPLELFQLTKLEILDLGNRHPSRSNSRNRFVSFPNELIHLVNLTELDLQDVGLQQKPNIDPVVFTALKTVNLSNNLLPEDPAAKIEKMNEEVYEEFTTSKEETLERPSKKPKLE